MTRTRAIAICTAILIAFGGASAGASALLTGKDIKNGSLAERDLRPSVRVKLNRPGTPGPQGERGVQGPVGASGATGATGPQGAQGVPGERGLRGPQGDQGERGPRGDQGERGERGPQGDPGADGQDGIVGLSEGVSGLNVGTGIFAVEADCPANKVAISGEYVIDPGNATNVDVIGSRRTGVSAEQWQVTISTNATTEDPTELTVQVICANA